MKHHQTKERRGFSRMFYSIKCSEPVVSNELCLHSLWPNGLLQSRVLDYCSC